MKGGVYRILTFMAAFSFIQYHINLSYKLAINTKLVNMNDIRLLL